MSTSVVFQEAGWMVKIACIPFFSVVGPEAPVIPYLKICEREASIVIASPPVLPLRLRACGTKGESE